MGVGSLRWLAVARGLSEPGAVELILDEPYLERLVFLDTGRQSYLPLIILYLTPGKSLRRPP
jgi:hypothetical protein